MENINEAKVKHPKPKRYSDLADLFDNINVGDIITIKNSNNRPVHMSVIKKLTELILEVKIKKQVHKLGVYRNKEGDSVLGLEEFDVNKQENVTVMFNDISHITVSDKKYMSKLIYDPEEPVEEPNNDNEEEENLNPTSSNVDSSKESILKRLSSKLGERVTKMLATSKEMIKNRGGKTSASETTSSFNDILDTSQMNGDSDEEEKIVVDNNYVSLSPNIVYKDDNWFDLSGSDLNETETFEFKSSPITLSRELKDILSILKQGDNVTLYTSNGAEYPFVLNQTDKGLNKIINSNQKFVVDAVSYNFKGKYIPINQISTVKKNGAQGVLVNFLNSESVNHKPLYSFKNVVAFTYKQNDLSFNILNNEYLITDIIESLKNFNNGSELVIKYRNYTSKTEFDETPAELKLKLLKLFDGGFKIIESSIPALKNEFINQDSLVYTLDKDGNNIGVLLQTFSGKGFGNILGFSNPSKDVDEPEPDTMITTDEELYSYILQDDTLRSYLIQKPTFFQWLKHRKNKFRGKSISINSLDKVSDFIGQNDLIGSGGTVNNGKKYVAKDFCTLKIVGIDNGDTTWMRNNKINLNNDVLALVRSSGRTTKICVFKNTNSKPYIMLKTEYNVFDVEKQEFTKTNFKATVVDLTGSSGSNEKGVIELNVV